MDFNITEANQLNHMTYDEKFLLAAENGWVDIVESYLSLYFNKKIILNLNAQNSEGQTALMYAAIDNNVKLARLLLPHLNKTDFNVKCNLSYTALMCAASHGNQEVLNEILPYLDEAALKATNEMGQTAFMWAAKRGRMSIIDSFIFHFSTRGISLDLNFQDKEGQTSLIYAASNGHLPVVNTLMLYLKSAVDLDICNNSGQTALMYAAAEGHTEIVKALIVRLHELDGDLKNLNIGDDDGVTALMFAAKKGQTTVLNLLIQYLDKAELCKADDFSQTALMFAAEFGHLACVLKLSSHLEVSALNSSNHSNETALALAAQNGHVDIVKHIISCFIQLKADLNLNKKDTSGLSALMWAAAKGHHDVVTLLIKHQPDLNFALLYAAGNGHTKIVKALIPHLNADLLNEKDNMGQNALMWAAHNGHVAIMNSLINLGLTQDLDEQDNQGLTALMLAIREGQLLAVKKLLAKNVEVTLTDHKGKTVLMHAAINGNLSIFELLMEYADPADLNGISDDSGKTVLMWAAKLGQAAIIEKILSHFREKNIVPNLNAQDAEGYSALMMAVLNGHLSTVELLLSNGAHSTLKNNDNETALIHAVSSCREDIFLTLVPNLNVNDINLIDNRGKTALMWAAFHGLISVVKILSSKGADFHIMNNQEETALVLAAQKGHVEVVNFIVNKFNISMLTFSNVEGMTPLMWAARNEHSEIVKIFIDCLDRVELNRADFSGKTALMHASSAGDTEGVNAFIRVLDTAALTSVDHTGKTALMWAAEYGHVEVVNAFINVLDTVALNIEDTSGNTALTWAVISNKIEVVNAFVLHKNISVLNAGNAHGTTALMKACDNNEEISLILINGILEIDITEVNKIDNSGQSALMIAALNEMTTLVNRLIPFLDIDALDKDNHLAQISIMLAAVLNGEMAIFEFLLPKLDAESLNSITQSGKTAIMWAAELGNLDMCNALIEKGVNLTVADENYAYTALMSAVLNGHEEVVNALALHLDAAGLNMQDEFGNTAMILATQIKNFSLVDILIRRGADVNLKNSMHNNALMIASNNSNQDITFRLLSTFKGSTTYIQNFSGLTLMNAEFKKLVSNTKKWLFDTLWIFNKIPGFDSEISSKIVSNQIIHPRWYHHLIEENVKSMLQMLDKKLVEKYTKTSTATPKLSLLAEVIPDVPPVEPVTLSRPKRKRGYQMKEDNIIPAVNAETRYPKRTNRSFKGSYSK